VLLCSSRSARWVSNGLFVCLGKGGEVWRSGGGEGEMWGSGKAEKGEVGD
jgi:hypothetical protein